MKQIILFRYVALCALVMMFFGQFAWSNVTPVWQQALPTPPDSIKLKYNFDDNDNNPYTQQRQSPLYLNDPSNIKTTVEYDTKTGQYVVRQKIGRMDYRQPQTMTLDEYRKYDFDNSMSDYWRKQTSNDRQTYRDKKGGWKDLLSPSIEIEGFDRIFGTNTIDIKPSGQAELIFGARINNNENPQIDRRLQRNVTFMFDENIQMGVTGKIGDKMSLGINYNTQAMFDFENKTKLAYEGKEDEIIKLIEAGNVSLPLTGTLITGAHSLFGLKTQLQFGRLTVTTVLSEQKGEAKTVNVQGGAMVNNFEIKADEYEENKHFFLSHYFKDNYDRALSNLPVVLSNVNITRLEVWVTNKTGKTDGLRNVVAFLDLGENTSIYSKYIRPVPGQAYPSNNSNDLYRKLITIYSGIRDIRDVTNVLNRIGPDFYGHQDYEEIENARKLDATQYTFNPKLGYLSLNSQLGPDEVLGVAFEYTVGNDTTVYKVGEFSNEGIESPKTLVLKLLKGTYLTPALPNWDLMMKNIYNINAFQVNKDDFKLEIMYRNDETGVPINYISDGAIKDRQLLQVMNLDRLNTQNEPGADGYFDFVEGTTIMAAKGRVIFPVREPFGSYLRQKITGGDANKNDIADEYVFEELYDSTQSRAQQIAEKNKFYIKGTYQSAGGSEISLNAFNIPQGSVKVTAGGSPLNEGSDYIVDYNLGRVTILNQGLLESGTPIQVAFESQSLFGIQKKTTIGSHFDYRLSDNFNVGATVLRLSEKPMTTKVDFGDEPISNTIWGLNTSYKTESPFLTLLVDRLPFLETKEKSSITIDAEFAQLVPGHAKAIQKSGVAYIDDFEASKISYPMMMSTPWVLASTPQGQADMFPEGNLTNDVANGFNRAKLSWYMIRNDFYENNAPDYISSDKDQLSNHFVRQILEKDIFPLKENPDNLPVPLNTLSLAFYPTEKGQYNYDAQGKTGISAGLDFNGKLKNPSSRWGGIMRPLTNYTDFETANIEFIEFWLMDPFVYDSTQNTGGDFYINLGDMSEDILRDAQKSAEHGLSPTAEVVDVDSSQWGRIPTKQVLSDVFNTDLDSRQYQDVGLDGLPDADEQKFFSTDNPSQKYPYINILQQMSSSGQLDPQVYNNFVADPSNDNYHHFLGSDYDAQKVPILQRYKMYNGLEGNSPAVSPEDYPTSARTDPDVEDINNDYTLNKSESYFQYRISIRPEDMVVGKNYITDVVVDNNERENGKKTAVKWYQFKIPIFQPDQVVGRIQDFKSIRFMRLFLTGFDQDIVLRFMRFDLVRGEWRKYNGQILQGQEVITNEQLSDGSFDVSAVNIEENATKVPVNYVLPDGIERETNPYSLTATQQNEQSLLIKTLNLEDGDAKAIYKNINLDMRQYQSLKMEIHAEEVAGYPLDNGELSVFIRLGSDFNENYYEYEIPLTITPAGRYDNQIAADRLMVWPVANRLDLPLDDLLQAKQARNNLADDGIISKIDVYTLVDKKKNILRIKGNPNLDNVRTIMIGIRNPKNDGVVKSGEVWLNELRLTDFREDGGWAANTRVQAQLADFGTVTLFGSTSKPGFGSIEKKLNERSKEEIYNYDASTNLELGKFFPKNAGIRLPMYVRHSETFSNPQYNPLDPDLEMDAILADPERDDNEKDSLLKLIQDYQRQTSINFTNIKFFENPKKQRFYNLNNWTAAYGFDYKYAHDVSTRYNITRNHNGSLGYMYNVNAKKIEPFRKAKGKFINSSAMKIVKEFHFYYMPEMVAFRNDVNKQFNVRQNRNIENQRVHFADNFKKDFLWNRTYDLKYKLTNSLRFDFNAGNQARIDEAFGWVNRDSIGYDEKRDTLWQNVRQGGRNTAYNHKWNVNWTLPIGKIPLLNWMNANYRYGGTYDWNVQPLLADPSIRLGNTIKNSNSAQYNVNFAMQSLYNKIPYLKKVDQRMKNQGKGASNMPQPTETVTYDKQGVSLKANKPYSINHRLGTQNVTVKVNDENGQEVKGQTEVVNEDKVLFTPEQDYKNASVTVSGEKEQKPPVFLTISDYVLNLMMGFKNLSVSYVVSEGTVMPGYMRQTTLMGLENSNGLYAPGIPFIAGLQNRNFPLLASEQGWLTDDTLANAPYTMTQNTNLNIRGSFEPLPDMRIDITALRTTDQNLQEFWTSGKAMGTKYGGNFNMSYFTWNTAFWKADDKGSAAFDNFLANRMPMAQRMASARQTASGGTYNPNEPNLNPDYNPADPSSKPVINDGYPSGYNAFSQDVLIPAFLAAYSNTSVDKVNTSAFPKIPLPNWNITYKGLSKIGIIKKIASNIDITHGYRSTYSVGAYNSNLRYDFDAANEDGFSYVRYIVNNTPTNFIPEREIERVTIDEQLRPLIGVNTTWKNSLSTKFDYSRTRKLELDFVGKQVIEMQTSEVTVGAGYRFDKVKLHINVGGVDQKFESDLNLRADVSVRNSSTYNRSFDGKVQPTAQQMSISIKNSADYALNERFNIRFFYDQTINRTLQSYRNSTAQVGFSIRFTLVP